jgi:hypothetical protein
MWLRLSPNQWRAASPECMRFDQEFRDANDVVWKRLANRDLFA